VSSVAGCSRLPWRQPRIRLPVVEARKMSGTPSSAAAGECITCSRASTVPVFLAKENTVDSVGQFHRAAIIQGVLLYTMNPSKTARKSMGEWDYRTRIIPLLSSMKPAMCHMAMYTVTVHCTVTVCTVCMYVCSYIKTAARLFRV
jgi:hypothetical protein